MPGDAKLIESTSNPSSALSAMVSATTVTCKVLIGARAMMSLGSVVVMCRLSARLTGMRAAAENYYRRLSSGEKEFVPRKPAARRHSGALNQRGSNGLTDVAGRVFGSMKQEAQHGGRETSAAHFAIVEQRVARRRPQLVHRGIDHAADIGDESGQRHGRFTRLPFDFQCGALRVRQ